MLADQVRVLRTHHTIVLAVDKQGGHLATSCRRQLDFERVALQLLTVFLCHLQSKRYQELWRLHVPARDLEGDHLERKKCRIKYHEDHVRGLEVGGVEEGR